MKVMGKSMLILDTEMKNGIKLFNMNISVAMYIKMFFLLYLGIADNSGIVR